MSDDRKQPPCRSVGYILPTDVVPANSDQRPTGSSGHKVFCLWPHSLQAYSTRPWSTSALTRLGAPHLLDIPE